jgi:hypothetical protein
MPRHVTERAELCSSKVLSLKKPVKSVPKKEKFVIPKPNNANKPSLTPIRKMKNKEEITEYLRTNKELLLANFGVTRFGIFGCFVAQTQQISSDIDLLGSSLLQESSPPIEIYG